MAAATLRNDDGDGSNSGDENEEGNGNVDFSHDAFNRGTDNEDGDLRSSDGVVENEERSLFDDSDINGNVARVDNVEGKYE